MNQDFDSSQVPRSAEAAATRRVLWWSAAAVGLLVLIALTAAVLVSREMQSARAAFQDVFQSREILNGLRAVMSTLQDAETGERGYVITGDESFLQPYRDAESSLEERLEDLRRVSSETDSEASLQELSREAQEQLAFLRNVIEVRRLEGFEQARALVAQEIGKNRMERIRELVRQLSESESARLRERLQTYQTRSTESEALVSAMLYGAAALLLIAGALLIRHTKRRLSAEESAREAFALMSATMDNVSEGVAVFDAERRLTAWNSRFLELHGVTQETVRGRMPLLELLEKGATLDLHTSSGLLDLKSAVRSSDALPAFDAEAHRNDGAVLQVRGRSMPGERYVLTYTDVTAFKHSEIAYRDQATRLTAILDNVVDAIITINESGSIESWSKGAERMFGYEAAEVLRRNVRILMPEPHSSAHDGYLRRYIQTGEKRIIGSRREVDARRKDGSLLPVDLGISEMQIGSRRLFIGIVRDISARREVEQLKSGFVSTVSHELRTPLTSISGSLGLLAGGVAGALPSKAARLIDIARLNSERLVRLINDILDLEKAESGKLQLELEVQQIRPIVEQAVDMNRSYAQSFGASIEVDLPEREATVLVDHDRVIQVLTNLLSNAAKYSPTGGVIRVTLRVDDERVCVSVSDQGPGISPEFQPRIFQRFAQADSSDARVKGGTGLGLSICKKIMELLGGSIEFETTSGAGTTFTISLPPHRLAAEYVSEGGDFIGFNVLICEDDPDVAALLSEILRREGMRAESVGSARAARAALGAVRFDLALIDLHLPDADGLGFIAELREREATRGLPVIVVSARSGHSAASGAALSALHLADWLQKPIDPQRLLDAIRSVLRNREGRTRILHVEDDRSLTQLVRELLSEEADVIAAHSLAEGRDQVLDGAYDLVILDIALGDGSGLDLLPLLQELEGGSPPVILYSATEASRELSERVQVALVKTRDSVQQLLLSVRRQLSRPPRAPVSDRARAGS